MTSDLHDFQTELDWSEQHEPLLRAAYLSQFPNYAFHERNSGDNRAQRAGVDRVLIGVDDTLAIDEKLRRIPYPGDVLLEYLSNDRTGAAGWMNKAQHQLAYLHCVYVPDRTGVLLRWPNLRAAWEAYGKTWLKQYRIVRAKNRGYYTESVITPERALRAVGVPINIYTVPRPRVSLGELVLPEPPQRRQMDLFRKGGSRR